MAHLPLLQRHSVLAGENPIYHNPVPPSPCPGGHPLRAELVCNPVKCQSSGPEPLHALQCSAFTVIPPKRLPALTATLFGPLPHSSAPELQYDLAFVVLCHGSHQLAHQYARRVACHRSEERRVGK